MKPNTAVFKDTILDAVSKRDSDKRSFTFIVSNENENRLGHVVRVKGWDVKNYMKNPVVLMNHDADALPVAKATRVWKDTKNKRLLATIQFPKEGELPMSDLVYKLFDNGLMNAVSPGYLVDFESAEYPKSEKGPSVIFNKQELLEISFATLPANPEALKQEKFIQEAFDLEIFDSDFIDKCYASLGKIEVEKENIDEEVEVENETESENDEEQINNEEEVEKDYLDKDVQEESLDEHEDPYALFYKALDSIIQEQKEEDSPEELAAKVIESFEKEDSQETLEDDFLEQLSAELESNNDKTEV